MQSEYGAIKSVMDLYGFAVDSQQWDLFDQVFTPDVDADWGGSAVWNDLEKFKQDFAIYHDPFDGTHHVMTNMVCDVQGDTAKAVTYGHWLLIREAATGGRLWRGEGWYDDELVRTADGWRISRRRCGIINSEGNPQVMGEGVEFNLETNSLRSFADKGAVSVLPGLRTRNRANV